MRIKYDHAHIQNVSAQFKRSGAAIQGQLEGVMGQVKALAASGHEGAAAVSYDSVQQKWNQGCDQVKMALAKAEAVLTNASIEMQTLDTRNAARFNA